MPNRMLRDWTGSEKVELLSVHAERFFVRLIMKADDFGCFWGDARLLKANLFPLLLDSIREADLSRWMAECQTAGLIVIYECTGKKYIRIVDFGQRLRQKHSKFPLPLDVSNMPTMVSKVPPEEKGSRIEEKGTEVVAPNLENSNLFRKPYIPTKQQVWEAISNAGGTKEMALGFWEKYESTSWYMNGSPLTNYVTAAQRFVRNWGQIEKKDTTQHPVNELKKL